MHRLVVVLCGPVGAGKTTTAEQSGLPVFDRDDPVWTSEKQFTARLADLARDPRARAVVIRSGATSSARLRAARLVGATHTFMVLADVKECRRRVMGRNRTDRLREVASLTKWFADFDRLDGVRDFPGWPEVLSASPDIGSASEEW